MRSNAVRILALTLMTSSLAFAQGARRLAVIEANGPLARTVPAFAFGEN